MKGGKKMGKIRDLSLSLLLTGYLALSGCNSYQVFEKPQNLAQRIANHVATKSEAQGYQSSDSSYSGYFDIFTRKNKVYRVGVVINDKTNEKSLMVDVLLTNVDFENKKPKSRNEKLKDQILYGKLPEPGIREKSHFYDTKIDEIPEIWHNLDRVDEPFQMKDLGKDSFEEWQDVSQRKLNISPKKDIGIREFLIKNQDIVVIQGHLAYEKLEKEGIRKVIKKNYMFALEDIAEVYGLD
ncbi:MAG: hypothetical protein L6408_02035 [Nanoarchaeota archaeon]|nr:hypothetical protein [Nanoarchaeota archaeon]